MNNEFSISHIPSRIELFYIFPARPPANGHFGFSLITICHCALLNQILIRYTNYDQNRSKVHVRLLNVQWCIQTVVRNVVSIVYGTLHLECGQSAPGGGLDLEWVMDRENVLPWWFYHPNGCPIAKRDIQPSSFSIFHSFHELPIADGRKSRGPIENNW